MNLLSLIVWLISSIIVSILIVINVTKKLKKTEQEALWEIMHVFFGIGLAAFWRIFLSSRIVILILAFICIIVWELMEECQNKTCSKNPIDTILDVILGMGFAYLYLLIV